MKSTLRVYCLMWLALISFITLSSVGLGEECVLGEKIVNNQVKSTAGCKYGNVTRKISSKTIQMVLNETAGALTVNFPSDYNTFYKVFLYSEMEAKTPDECKEFKEINLLKLHSERIFSTSSCKEKMGESASQVYGSVVFHFVYSSCYVVRIGNVYTEPRLLETKYKFIPPEERRPRVGSADTSSELYNGRRNITITFKNFSLLVRDKIPVHMFLVQNTTCDMYTEENVIARYSVHETEDGNLKCTKQKDLPFVKNCKADANASSCTFINLIPGNYCLGVEPDEPDRCKKTAPWKNYIGCSFQHTFDVKGEPIVEKPLEITVDTLGSNMLAYLAVALSIISFIVISAIIRTLHRNLPTLEPPEVRILHSNPEVVLLYAQDCEIFMELMEVFREVLSTIGQCKVLDCFNYNCDSMTLNPAEWIQQLITCQDVKIILVSSPCAEVHQRAVKEKKSVRYHDPKPYNHLFPLALYNVKHNIQRTYTNTYVVRFDHTDLESIMPYTRYDLPGYLHDLLTDMHLFSFADKNRLQEYENVKKLHLLHIKLKEYFKKNPDYVKQLMYSLESCNF